MATNAWMRLVTTFKNSVSIQQLPALGLTQPPIQWVPRALIPWVKRPKREANHPTPSTAEVKNAWSYTSTPQYVFAA